MMCPPLASKASAALFVTALLSSGCGSPPAATPPAASEARSVELVHPQRGDIVRSITLPGNVAAWQQATLYAKVGGYLKTMRVDRGDEVKTGSVLAELEVPELQADIAKAKADLDNAALLASRTRDARRKAPDLVTAQSEDDAGARMAAAQATLARQQSLLGFATITAPFDGIVTQRFVDPGAFVPAATTGSTPQNAAILTVADFSRVRVRVAVPEPEVPRVQPGAPAEVLLDELPGRSFAGSVSRVAYALDDATRTMPVEIDLGNADRTLRPGMYATARIGVEKHTNALLLPASAVVVEKNGRSVFVVDAESRAHKRPVKTGFETPERVEILDGLGEADSVVATKALLAEGQPVRDAKAKDTK